LEKKSAAVEVVIEEIKSARPSEDGTGVLIEADAEVDGEKLEATIEVDDEDTPEVAAALMNAGLDTYTDADGPLPAAIKCLAAGVLHVEPRGQVRLHLQFESGKVLPVEMSRDAAEALARGLSRHLAS
jgi:hypothetical protein